MPRYHIEVKTSGRESYYITADNEAHARQIFENDAPTPAISEVVSCEIEHVEELDD